MSIGLCQIANFHFNIKHSKPFDKAFQGLDKTVGKEPEKGILGIGRFLSGSFRCNLNPNKLHSFSASHRIFCQTFNMNGGTVFQHIPLYQLDKGSPFSNLMGLFFDLLYPCLHT